MIKKNLILISLMLIGLLCYAYGFIWFSKINTIIMFLGSLLIFAPLIIIGINIRRKRETISTVLIALSCFFIFFIIVTMAGYSIVFYK